MRRPRDMSTEPIPSGAAPGSRRSLPVLAAAVLAVLALILALLLGMGLGSRSASAAPVAAPGVAAVSGGVSVLGTASVTGTPDTLTLSMSVAVTRPSASEALAAANAAAAKLHAALKERGVADADLQTSGLSLYPNYTDKSVIKGYQAGESVTAKLRDLKTAGATIGAVATAAGDDARIDGIRLGLESDSTLLKEARAKAVADAKVRAETYAQAADRSVGAVLSIAEPGVSFAFQPKAYGAAESAQATASDVPLQVGSQDIQVSVTVTYELR
jgi:uncharacterized protein YggE